MTARLVITDGATTVSLLGPIFNLREWRPNVAPFKGGGLYADSPLGDNRVLVDYHFENGVDTFELTADGISQDDVIRWTQELRRLLMKAANYRSNQWPTSPTGPVWIEAKASKETNTRYALIVSGLMAEDDGPFRQPFLQPNCLAVMDKLELIIEHEHWQEVRPGLGVCLPLTIRTDFDIIPYVDLLLRTSATSGAPFGLWKFNETSGTTARNYSVHGSLMNASYLAGVILNDLTFLTGEPAAFISLNSGVNAYSTTFNTFFDGNKGSLLLWIRTSGLIWTSGNEHWIFRAEVDSNNKIWIYKSTTDGQIVASITANGVTRTATLSGLTTTDWFSLGLTWSNDDRQILLYINGEVRAVDIFYTQPFTGSLSSFGVIFGAETLAGVDALSSDIAYAAIWDYKIPSSTFSRFMTAPNPGDDETSCEIVYVANKRNALRISHAWYNDVSIPSFSANLIGLAYTVSAIMLPLVPAVGDLLYFGSSTTTSPQGGPFSSVVLDITGIPKGYTGTWEYYNGAWVALENQDNSGGLLNPGISSVHWLQPSDWIAVSINGVTAYWVRFRLTGAVSTVPPSQQNRSPYTINRPYIQIPAGSLAGDIPALIRLVITGWADQSVSGGPALTATRVYAGSRRLSRGDFPGYINLGLIQNTTNIVNTVGTNTLFTVDTRSTSGQSAIFNPTGVESLTTRVTTTIDAGLATALAGTYRCFVRGRATGSTTAWTARVVARSATGIQQAVTDTVAASGGGLYVFELGQITLPPGLRLSAGELSGNIEILTQVSSSNGTDNLHLYDLILIPTDELSFLAESGDLSSFQDMIGYYTNPYSSFGRTKLNVDGALDPKWSPKAQLEAADADIVISRWRLISPPDIALDADEGHRLWFLFVTQTGTVLKNEPEFAAGVSVERVARYLSGRGSR